MKNEGKFSIVKPRRKKMKLFFVENSVGYIDTHTVNT